MSASDELEVIASSLEAIDDCWNRIGVHGDKSCPLLEAHIHCRNCEVYAAAATRLLDRYALSQDEHVAAAREEHPVARSGRSLLVFRLGEEWLALATRCLVEVAPLQSVHSLPHQRSRVLQGVANVRGALVPCLSLADLLELEVCAVAASARVMPRMLIVAAPGGSVVLPVDEVDGIHVIDLGHLNDEASGDTRFTAAVLQWRGRSVRVLDEQQLLSAVNRSLS